MKALNLVSLALSAAALMASYATAADISFCTLGAPSNDIQTFSAGDKKVGTLCSISEGDTLRFDGNTSPQTHVNNTAATIELTITNVAPRALVWIQGLESESTAATTVPYIVNLNQVIFNQGAMLVIQGSFGKGSDISISGCSFNVGAPLASFSSSGAFGILLFDNANVHRLYDNGHIRITSNTFNVISDPSNSTAAGIGATSQLKLGAGSSVDISKNTIRVRNTAGGSYGAYGVIFGESIIPQGNDASFNFISNTIEASYATPLYLPEVASPTFSFIYNVSVNSVKGTPCYAPAGSAVAALIRPISLGGDSKFAFSTNTITTNASDALVMSTSFSLNDNAMASLNDNELLSSGGSPAFGIQNAVTIPSRGQLIFEFNNLRRNDTLPASLTPFFFTGAIQLQGLSTLSISHNDFDALNKTVKMAFIGQSGSNDVTKGANANAYACYNRHYAEQLDSATMQSIYITPAIRAIINDVSTCMARQTTPPPTTTTTPTSTTTTTTTTAPTPVTGGTRATLPGQQTTTQRTSTTAPAGQVTASTTFTAPVLPEENGASSVSIAAGALAFVALVAANLF